MKKKFYLIVAFLLAGSASASYGQYVVTRETETIVVENNDGHKVVNISHSSQDRVTVQVAGMEIVLGNKSIEDKTSETTWQKRLKKLNLASPGHIGLMEIGINMLPSPDYSLYANTLPGEEYLFANSFLHLNHGKSISFSFCIADFSIKLAPAGMVSLTSGLQLTANNYTFSNQVTLTKSDGRVIPAPVPNNTRKSKLTTFGFQIPVLLELNLPHKIFIAGGLYGGMVTSNRAVFRRPVNRENNMYINPFYWGSTVRLGHDSFFVYGNYNLSELFQENRGPVVFPATIGFGFSF